MSDLAAIVARDAQWEPQCQYVLLDSDSARVLGTPWPITLAQADGYQRVCRRRLSDHPASFVGAQWNHAEPVYDPALDRSVEAERRALLDLLREMRDALAFIAAEDVIALSQSMDEARRRIATLALDRLAALDTEAPA